MVSQTGYGYGWGSLARTYVPRTRVAGVPKRRLGIELRREYIVKWHPYSNGEGYQSVRLSRTASTTFNVQNDHGADSTQVVIDTPSAQNTSLTGMTSLAGSAINNEIAAGTVSFLIDGGQFAQTTPNIARTDVCNVFPNASSCPDVGWSVPFDTTLLPDGEQY